MTKKAAKVVAPVLADGQLELIELFRKYLVVDTDTEHGYYGDKAIAISVKLFGVEVATESVYVPPDTNWCVCSS